MNAKSGWMAQMWSYESKDMVEGQKMLCRKIFAAWMRAFHGTFGLIGRAPANPSEDSTPVAANLQTLSEADTRIYIRSVDVPTEKPWSGSQSQNSISCPRGHGTCEHREDIDAGDRIEVAHTVDGR